MKLTIKNENGIIKNATNNIYNNIIQISITFDRNYSIGNEPVFKRINKNTIDLKFYASGSDDYDNPNDYDHVFIVAENNKEVEIINGIHPHEHFDDYKSCEEIIKYTFIANKIV